MSRRRGEDEKLPGEREWLMIGLDEKMARRQGMPKQIPVPKDEFEQMADKGLNPEIVCAWVKDFLTNSAMGQSGEWRRRQSAIVYSLEAYVDKQPIYKKAQEAFAKNDYDAALKALKKITILDDADDSAKLNLASAHANKGEHDKALKLLKQVATTFADDPDYHVTVAQLHVSRQDLESATNELVLALEAKPDHRPAMDLLVKLGVLVQIYENPKDAASITFVRADSVADYLQEFWDKEERTADFYLEQLGYHAADGRHAVALAAAERALAAADGPSRERAELGRVAALRSLGRKEPALEAARAWLEKAPQSPSAHVEGALCLQALGNDAGATAEAEAALACDVSDLEAIYLRYWPRDRESLAEVGEALPAMRAFAEAHSMAPGPWRSLARALLVAGNEEEALATFKKASDLAPSDDELRSEWWQELARATRYDEILADVAKIGDISKRSWKLRWNEAEAYLGMGKMMEARACLTAINMDDTLHVDIRKRAKRVVSEMGAPAPGAPPAGAPAA